MKKIATMILCCLIYVIGRADEGMWLPSLISERIADMQSKGFRLEAEDIYSINQASLKDAVVLFGRGCTGEMISAEGLLLTNHHCGYAQVQKHSSVEHDYLKDGFWAMRREEELPNEDLTVSFLDRMEDVTGAVLKGYDEGMSETQRDSVIRANSATIINATEDKEKGINASVEALYYGNQYFLFVYRTFRDIRLVGAPPSSIGRFGGDTDNWMWPRHTGDFSLFRVYADSNNEPASYSADNIPYTPKKFFKISTSGIREGDFTFIYGFPGSTREYIHSEEVRFLAEVSDPAKVELRTIRLDIMNRYMAKSQDVRIKYATKKARVANAWKKWQGESGGIKKMRTVQTCQEYEKNFREWSKGTEYEGIADRIAGMCNEFHPERYLIDHYAEIVRACELSEFAASVIRNCVPASQDRDMDLDRLRHISGRFFKDYHEPIDRECFTALMKEFGTRIPDEEKPDYFKEQMAIYGCAENWADSLFGKSIFADKKALEEIGPRDFEKLLNDPAAMFYRKMTDWIIPHSTKAQEIGKKMQLAYRDYMRGQMEFSNNVSKYYPDANLTLRVAYGHVKGYSPSDGIYFEPISTLTGILEKDNPDIFDYNIPQSLRDIYARKDFGRWTDENGEVPVCFLATNHTSGGNSGSPVINADGNLVGINFDRVWEGTMSDIDFDPDFCRNISLDIRYVLFIIDKVADADHLLDEMTFVL